MNIYVGFSHPKSFSPFASLIEAVEDRGYDHVYIRIQEAISNRWMVFQASGLVVNLISAENFFNNRVSLKEYEVTATQVQYKNVWDFINQNLGLPYSLIEDFGILLMKIFKLKNQPFNQGGSAWFCSKLGAKVCEILDIPIPEDVSDVDPTALDSILAAEGLPIILNPIFAA
jgi:hypothetical protein